MKKRKQSESPPVSRWLRSKNGTPFLITRTRHFNDADEWLYRCDYGDVKGHTLFSLSNLEAEECSYLSGQPDDWVMGPWRIKSDKEV